MSSSSRQPRHSQSIAQTQGMRQQTSLSPQQVLFVRLLGLNALELEDDVRRTLDETPALEAYDDASTPTPDEMEGLLAPPSDNDDGPDFDESAETLQVSDFSHEDDIPFAGFSGDVEDFISSSGKVDPGLRARERADSNVMSTVMDYLADQLAELPLTDRQRVIAENITGNIDDNGYLTVSLRQIADDLAIHEGIDASADEVAEVFLAIRDLDPAGIAAVDLRDCLLLQLRRREAADPQPDVVTAREIVADYFDLFSRQRFEKLCSALGITREELRRAVKVIRSLNPKPGAIISGSRVDDYVNQITPDFIVETDGHSIDLRMTSGIPALRVESSFDIDDAALPPRRRGARDDAAFIRSRRDDAIAYIHAIDQRRKTLYRVMRAIISLQREFFTGEGDPTVLRPMILKDVAAITGDDISVVSRATAGKYVSTRSGTYPLKFFFNEAPSQGSTDSTHKIVETLREIIAGEDPSAPLSDEAIAEALHARGYNIARRTVAKYREKALIPVARLRRRV